MGVLPDVVNGRVALPAGPAAGEFRLSRSGTASGASRQDERRDDTQADEAEGKDLQQSAESEHGGSVNERDVCGVKKFKSPIPGIADLRFKIADSNRFPERFFVAGIILH